jgi:hypothetical protein
MTSDAIAGLIAEPARLRVLAAIALGATTSVEVAASAGVPAREVAGATRRLMQAGVVVSGAGGLAVSYERLRAAAKAGAAVGGTAGGPAGNGLHPFVSDGRLTSMPAQQSRRRTVLQHIAETSFEAGVAYDERQVNEKLRAWCEGSDVDHVAVRRYLIDMAVLTRSNGIYSRDPAALPERGEAERHVTAMGLD